MNDFQIGIIVRSPLCGDHAAVADEDEFADAVFFPQFFDVAFDGGGILGVAGENFDGDGAAFGVGEEADDDWFVASLAVAVVAELDEFAVCVLAFEVGAGDVVKDDATVTAGGGAEVGFGEGLLDGGLAGWRSSRRSRAA
jgi:hypothetical protein